MIKYRIGIFQSNPVWEDVKANRYLIEEKMKSLNSVPDIFILPEMFTTGFSMNPSKIDSKLLLNHVVWQKALSDRYHTSIMGSVVYPLTNNLFTNRFISTSPNNEPDFYDKRHLFLNESASGYYASGTERVLFNVNGLKIMPQICYDLRFPIWSRNDMGYHLLIYSANWPSARQNVWKTLLPARAIENQCYVIGVNRVGVDGNNIQYVGGSVAVSPKGDSIFQLNDNEAYGEVDIDLQELKEYKERYPFYKDADAFKINKG